ncbi:hypothetical protein Tco_0094620, partial [Tanacetum coccineum]
MYITSPHSSFLLRRASRSSSTTTVTKLHSFAAKPQPSSSPEVSTQCRSYCGVSSGFRSRWSHGADWKSSPASQIRCGGVGSTVLD